MDGQFWKKGILPLTVSSKETFNLSNVSSLGSCFSKYLFRWLKHHNIVPYDNAWGILYNPSSIYHEVARLYSNIDWKSHVLFAENEGRTVCIDPWRSWISANSIDELEDLNHKLDIQARKQLEQSETIIITYGLIEVWKKRNVVGNYLNELPYSIIKDPEKKIEYEPLFMTFDEVENILKETVAIINEKMIVKPNIVLTLSPVPLKFNFTYPSLREANNISKATQLICLHNVAKEYENVHYFPSFELAQSLAELNYSEFWQDDDRHVNAKSIDKIIRSFIYYTGSNFQSVNELFYVPLYDKKGKIIGKIYEDGTRIFD